eukprot:jgi/Psemu1/29190/gm1.29190_g
MKLGLLFPKRKGGTPFIGISLTNPMDWKSSPSNFSACTETVANLASGALLDLLAEVLSTDNANPNLIDPTQDHRTEAPPAEAAYNRTRSRLLIDSTTPYKKPVRQRGVYIDDFCGLAQGNQWTRRTIKRVLFHSLDKAFQPKVAQDSPFRQKPASLKKMLDVPKTPKTATKSHAGPTHIARSGEFEAILAVIKVKVAIEFNDGNNNNNNNNNVVFNGDDNNNNNNNDDGNNNNNNNNNSNTVDSYFFFFCLFASFL